MYVDESRGVGDGYWCKCVDQHIDWCDRDNCKSEEGYQDCPIYNGDPILDEATCKAIEDTVKDVVREVESVLKAMAYELSETIRSCGMESMNWVGRSLSDYSMRFPSVPTLYSDQIHLRSEEQLASEMARNIDEALLSMRMPYVATSGTSTPVVSSEDFYRLSAAIEHNGQDAVRQFNDFSVGLSGKQSVFEEPVREFMIQCGQAIDEMVRYLNGIVGSAESQFEQGVLAAIAGADQSDSYRLSETGIQWDFDGYI